MNDRPIIQIAGVTDADEARLLLECGVQHLGFPLRLTVNKEDLGEDDARRVIADLPTDAHAVLITYMDRADAIAEFCRFLGVRIVQLHGPIAVEELRALRAIDPTLDVFKSLVVRPDNQAQLEADVHALAPYVEAFITDTFNPSTGAEGATGMTHDWSISRRLVEISPRPVILAGGLTPDNVAEAIRAVQPAGVDSHTGVEGPDGRKDAVRVRAFVERTTRAFSAP